MKRLFIILVLLSVALACKDQLDVVNPNQPTPEALNTESGIIQFGTGVYFDMVFPDATFDFVWIAQAAHEAMGDAIYIPWGNWGWRWANQPSSITLDDGTVVVPPQEGDQALSLKLRNTRAVGDVNLFAHEWITMYFVNNSCNLILEKLEEGISFSGNQSTKSAVLQAWARWWKGYAYSRIGSMYVAGLINDEAGETNGDFVTNAEVLTEAEDQFQQAITILQSLSVDDDYTSMMERLIPALYRPTGIPTPEEWIRNINTMRARNLLVNSKDSDKTAEDWNAIATLATSGMQAGDFEFILTSDDNNFILTAYVPARLLLGWHFASERLIQDFKAGDDRYTRNFAVSGTPQVNRSGRGIQYGTRYEFVSGDYASTERGGASVYIGPTYEENVLMRAEALVNTGSIDPGLALVDEVRDYQSSGLVDVSGTGLTLGEAMEELRIERRIGLLLRGLPFYDARRWGVIDPVSEGGGRTGAVVLDADGNVNTNATFDYKYMDYFDVPVNELEFNQPNKASAPVVENPK